MSRPAPPRALGVHAMLSDGSSPWLPPGVPLRVVTSPAIGFPLGPLAVHLTPMGEIPDIEVPVTPLGAVQPIGGGWRIDGDAWLLLDLPADRPLPIQVTLIAEGDGDPLTMSVVRRVGDRGVGIATRSEPPYRLAAPRVTVVRVSGHGVVDDEVRVGFAMAPELEASQGVALGLPAGMLGDDPASPRYLGQDPDGSQAWQRVQEAAPGAVAPHERWDAPAIAPSPDDEVERVRALTHGWLEATLADLLALPVEQRPDLQRPQPHLGLGAGARPVTAAVSPLDALLTAAAVDPGLARWLGLAWLAPDPQPDGRNDLVLVTVAGRWGMPRSRLADMMAMLGDPGTVAAHLQAVGCDDQLSLTDGAPHTVVDLWAQAVVSRSAPPDPPPALVLHADLAPRWLSRPPGAARQSLRLDGVAPLGQVGVARVGADAQPVPLAGTVDPPAPRWTTAPGRPTCSAGGAPSPPHRHRLLPAQRCRCPTRRCGCASPRRHPRASSRSRRRCGCACPSRRRCPASLL